MVSHAVKFVDWYGKGGRHQNRRTPRSIFDPLHKEFNFTLDGASEPGNGLLPLSSTADVPINWTGYRVFCNPPWSNIGPFIEQAPRAHLAVFLVPARTNAKWFHRALELGAKPRFFLGRPHFEIPGEDCRGHNSPVDCLLLIFRNVQEACPHCLDEMFTPEFSSGEKTHCQYCGKYLGPVSERKDRNAALYD